MSPNIRTCRSEDLSDVQALYLELPGGQVKSDEEPLSSRLSEFFLIGEVDKQIVGFVIGAKGPVDLIGQEMARESFPGDEAYLEIQDLYVTPSFRNQGIGSLLIRAMVQRGLEAGLTRSMVYTNNTDYSRIGRFYERFGYKINHLFMSR